MQWKLPHPEALNNFLEAISLGRIVYTLEKTGEQYHLVQSKAWNPATHTLGDFRPVEPIKSLVFKPRENLGDIFTDTPAAEITERVVIGVKNCDLSALKIHDHVFLHSDPLDPAYANLREKTILVSVDCACAGKTCFCTAVREQPYAKEGFDINISPLGKGYVIETGSRRGEEVCQTAVHIFEKIDDKTLKARDELRAKVYKEVEAQAALKGINATQDFTTAVKKTLDGQLWDDFAEDCVECGACNLACCTCHCFLLSDGVQVGGTTGISRNRQWDSCLFRNFARVAGGGNPRHHRAERLYNRFDKKFVYFPEIIKKFACDGCGRCVESCTGKIDIREVLKKAVDEAKSL